MANISYSFNLIEPHIIQVCIKNNGTRRYVFMTKERNGNLYLATTSDGRYFTKTSFLMNHNQFVELQNIDNIIKNLISNNKL